MGDFVWLVEVLENHLPPSESPGVFVKPYKHILKFWWLCIACRSSRKLFTTFRSPGVCEKYLKNIQKLRGLWRIYRSSRKLLTPSGSPGVFIKSYKGILEPGGFFMACRSSRKLFTPFSKSWSVWEIFEKYSKA